MCTVRVTLLVNNNLDWTDICATKRGGLDPVGLSVGSGGESPTTHQIVLVAPQGDHIVDHERSLECDRLNCNNIGQGVFP